MLPNGKEDLFSHLQLLEIRQLRNLTHVYADFSSGLNLILGSNGAGKTSICEAISLLFHGRSFRSAADLSVLTQSNAQCFQISARLRSEDLSTRIHMKKCVGQTWQVYRDDERLQQLRRITGLMPLLVLSPEVENYVDTDPAGRRRLLDWIMFHVEHDYQRVVRGFSYALKQRNHLLRTKPRFDDELSLWTLELALYGSQMHQRRLSLIESLQPYLLQEFQGTPFESYSLTLKPGWRAEDLSLLDALNSVQQMELRRKGTFIGPQRGDIIIADGYGNMAKAYLSRGEKKRLSLLICVASLKYLSHAVKKKPLLVIDDWQSELDQQGQDFILSVIDELQLQTIMTSADPKDQRRVDSKGRVFHVEHGQLSPLDEAVKVC